MARWVSAGTSMPNPAPASRYPAAESELVDDVGQLRLVLLVTVAGEQVTGHELVAGPARLAQLEVAVLGK